MSNLHRPHIKMSLSKWEIFLLMINFLIIITSILYILSNWESIPKTMLISGKSAHENLHLQKIIYVQQHFFWVFLVLFSGISYFLLSPRNGNWKGARSVSNNLQKAQKQYRVESSCFLSNLSVINLFFSIYIVSDIRYQIDHLHKPNIHYLIFAIAIVWGCM
jgi:hypothetical protein